MPIVGRGLDAPFQVVVPASVDEPWDDYRRNGYHHPQTTAMVARLVREDEDAHLWELATTHGYYPLLARRVNPDCDVTLFEDDPDRIGRIGRSFAANDCDDPAVVPRRLGDPRATDPVAAGVADPPTVVHAAGGASLERVFAGLSSVLVEETPALVLELDVGEFGFGDRRSFVSALPRTGYDYYWAQKPSRCRSRWHTFDPTESLPSQNTTCLLLGLPTTVGTDRLRERLGSASVVDVDAL